MHVGRDTVKALSGKGGDATVDTHLPVGGDGKAGAYLAAEAQMPLARLHLLVKSLPTGQFTHPLGLGIDHGDLGREVQGPAPIVPDKREHVEVALHGELGPAGGYFHVVEVPAVHVQDLGSLPLPVRRKPVGAAVQVELALAAHLETSLQGDEAVELVSAEEPALQAPVTDTVLGNAVECALSEGSAAADPDVPGVLGGLQGR